MEQYNKTNVKMEITRTSKNIGSHKFIIKPKQSLTHLRSQNTEPQGPTSSDQEVELFLQHMSQKSKIFKEMLVERGIDEQDFCQRYLFRSICLKTILKSVLDRMLSDRRLGKNLKGLNRSNQTQIESQIRCSVLRQIELYKNDKDFKKGKQQLEEVLAQRKRQILQQLQKLRQNTYQETSTNFQ